MNADGYALDEMSSIEAEHMVLGSLLLDNRVFDRISDKIKPEYFFTEQNKAIFAEIQNQISKGKECDPFTVSQAMNGKASLSEVNALAQSVPSAANVHRYVEIVLERFKARALMAVSAEITELSLDRSSSIESRIEKAQSQLAKLLDEAPRDEWVGAYEGMLAHSAVLERRHNGEMTAWPTGLMDLDEYLEGGLRPGELVIVGARPSMGKTALGLTIGVNMAAQRSVAVLSMEMSHMEVNDRLTAMLGNVSMSAVKRPSRGEGLAWDRVMEGVDKAKQLRLNVCDQGGLNLNQVKAKARNAKRLTGLEVLIVDYIGLMTGLDPKANRNTQLGEISRGLKTLAKELQICVLCLAQLNRKTEERPDQMPQMSDLRDSGEIEQDADVIVFIKRPIMANADMGEEWKHYAKLSIAKNRQGRCGYLDLSYLGEQTRFAGWSGPAPTKQSAPTNHRGGAL